MTMNVNKKRKPEQSGIGIGDGNMPLKKEKKDFNKSNRNHAGKFGNSEKPFKRDWGSKGLKNGDATSGKKKGVSKQQREARKKQLTSIVTEAKANYQLYTDKKVDKKEQILLMESTYNLVKDHIPELARMKGMGKVISSLVDKKNKDYILSNYKTRDSKLLLMKGNGYKLAIKLIKLGGLKTVQEFADACVSNSKGLRSLMSNFQSARSLCAVYANGSAKIKSLLLRKLVLGNMSVFNQEASLNEVLSSCKNDVIEECKTFLQSVLNEKTIRHDVIQDILAICLQTQKLAEADVESFVALLAENILHLCQRSTKSTLPMWVVWLSNAQLRKRIMKNLKGKVATLLQTYNGRMFLIALIESTDDTKALDKFVLKELANSFDELTQQAEGRRLLEFILSPRSTKFMHPSEIEVLRQGDVVRTSKKSEETRFDEIRKYMQESFLEALMKNCATWLKDNKMCLFIVAIVGRYGDHFDETVLKQFSTILTSSEFSERVADKAVRMVLDSLITADISRFEKDEDAYLFLNQFVQSLKSQAGSFVEKCPQQVLSLQEAATKLQQKLEFKLEKSWLCSTATQKVIKKYKQQKQKTNI